MILEFSVKVVWGTFVFQTLSFHLCDAELVTGEEGYQWEKSILFFASPRQRHVTTKMRKLGLCQEQWVSFSLALVSPALNSTI